jgi:hypothetical protein
MGWELPGGTATGGFFRYANSFRHHSAEMTIGSMVYGGTFDRHPTSPCSPKNSMWLGSHTLLTHREA